MSENFPSTESSLSAYGSPASSPEKTPPYWLAVFCLIPVLGFFAGILILILGLIKYKNKLFPILGGIGIALNITICTMFIYQAVKKWHPFRDSFSMVSEMQLETLVKDIEYYKVKNGQYPDSLPQLRKSDKTVSIHDPLQTEWSGPNARYNYKKIGEKYTVFSSGPDGIPGTKDDIYPNIEVSDSSKIGFIKESE
jgi:hypothetical protein